VRTPSAASLPLALGLAADTAMPRQLQQRLAGALIVVPRGQSLPSSPRHNMGFFAGPSEKVYFSNTPPKWR
jgi:hypothetical protein